MASHRKTKSRIRFRRVVWTGQGCSWLMTGWLPLRCPLTAFESAAVICWPRPGPSPAAARPCSQRTGSGCLFFLLFSFSRGERKTHKTLAALRQAKTVCSGSGIRLDGQYYLIMCVRITPSPPPINNPPPFLPPLHMAPSPVEW